MGKRILLGIEITESDAARFWAKVDVRSKDECWPWLASCKDGYGQFKIGTKKHGKAVGSHRVVAVLCDPDFDPAAHYMHSCDNPPCCNPAHISAGTHAQNIADMATRGRNTTPRPGNGKRKIAITLHPEIRRRFAAGENKSALARHFGVSPPRIRQILQGV